MSDRRYKHPQVNLRLPEDLKARINELAEANGRSANAEMVAALEAWAEKHKGAQALNLASIAERLASLEEEVKALKEN
ncbi:Arc family DNA-binding protein [Citrobacter freundii]|uniref:Arc family DNA-binding protein n=1 Tax=Enterobacteriaceae TaxID=543 RepID=UPI0007981F5D|nr:MULTISPECIES: Arc family DNA-binding protein [Enterobacteriaceae]HED1414712.1 Arc family DNA-binding protein [Enterobacter hormaechei subsp. steigerwaltii]ELQ7921691.1 Arc family DNA-binding protein [Citrobacter freundii]MBK4528469.1 Arc family DNA-binding protein [Enterobacter cloacae]MBK4602982.1 Arc family DNA-binding protein [Enterobacter cloacae]MBK4654245.1 Arc family DNA-binding protein [Enterobacter cloacae]